MSDESAAQWPHPQQPTSTKRCPRCGQDVPVSAMTCGACNYDPRGFPAGPYGWTPYGPVQLTRVNGLAVASMVLGILWLYWIGSAFALIFGFLAKRQIERSGCQQTGSGMALAGIILGFVGFGLLVLLLLVLIVSALSSSSAP